MNARELHESLTIIDGHCDTILDAAGQCYADGKRPPRDLLARGETGHSDIPRLLEGGVSGQFMALFTTDKALPEANSYTHGLLDTLEKLCTRTDRMFIARSAAEIAEAKIAGRIAALVAIEGGEAIGTSLDELKTFYDRGVRLMTLTWSRRNAIGRGVKVEGTDGLSEFGHSVVREMERLGMIVDVSHCADETLLDVLSIARRPLVASHSNSRELCPHPRNLTDDLARLIAATGGLVAVTFAGIFVDTDPAKVNVGRMVDHIERLLSVIGADHVGLGTDFDGFTDSYGLVMKDSSHLPELTAAMLDRGIAPDVIAKVMGGNWSRVIAAVVG